LFSTTTKFKKVHSLTPLGAGSVNADRAALLWRLPQESEHILTVQVHVPDLSIEGDRDLIDNIRPSPDRVEFGGRN
jgi:hypothetical protein